MGRALGWLEAARGQLFPFVPVCLACGIGLWFALPFEPGPRFYALAAIALVAAVGLWRWGPGAAQPLFVAAGCLAAGMLAAGARAHLVAAPMLDFRYYGPVTGEIVEIDRSQSDALRLTLAGVALADVARGRTPATVRLSLHGPPPATPYAPGQVVMTTAFLAAPESPAEPGGFDFRRMAFFNRLGAVGYTRAPVLLWTPPEPGAALINRLRHGLSAAIEAAVPGDAGAFASGVMTGDRSNISAAVVQDLRLSSLAHLLAISGMNMAFLTGFVFALTRYGTALVPPLALRVNAKKLAAVAAFGVALFYLLLSGANVATTRAFLMVTVMLGAILLDRRALTFRSVALAAILLLVVQPESLTEPGFQLSFAATVALIAGFGPTQRLVQASRLPGWLRPVAMLVATALIAGLATAPYSAATFNRFTNYGLMANLLTVPVMSVLMGAGAMAALLAPIGLAGPALWVMELASRWILFVAHWVAGLQGAVLAVKAPGPWVLPLFSLGALLMILWPGRLRWAGAAPVLAAVALWTMAERPALLISSDGVLAGLMGPQGRALSSPRGAGFAAESWLADDGDLALPAEAAARPGFAGPKTARGFELAGLRWVLLTGKGALEAASSACAGADVVVVPASLGPVAVKPPGCLVIDRTVLEASGALAVQTGPEGPRLVPARSVPRLWLGGRHLAESIALPKKPAQLAADQ